MTTTGKARAARLVAGLSEARRGRARRLAAGLAAAAQPEVEVSGPVTVEGETSGDGRRIDVGALSWPDDPVPILFDLVDGDHTGTIVGAYTRFERADDGTVVGYGSLGPTDNLEIAGLIGRVVELMDARQIGQSVGLDQVEAFQETRVVRDDDDPEAWRYDDWVTVVTSARVRHVALVDTPAFQQCIPAAGHPAMVAGVAVRALPAAHFARWTSPTPVPFTVEADGRVWGHAAGTGCHRSAGTGCVLYDGDVDPSMAGFHTAGPVTLDDGTTVRVGPVTFGGLHADTAMTRDQRRAHHEAGSTVVALVRAWDDDRGRLAVAGTLVAGLDATTVDQLRACAPSYERWPERGGLTLCGLHLVPMPAHPVATAAAAGGPQVGVDCLCDDGCDVCGRPAV